MKKQRLLLFLILLLIIPVGFYTKFYTGPGQDWIGNSMGGLIYEIFWCLIAAMIFPFARSIKIAIIVFILTCLIEVSQLWHPPLLEAIRLTFIGRTILGNSFNWMDFPYYAIGCFIGWALLTAVRKAASPNPHTSG